MFASMILCTNFKKNNVIFSLNKSVKMGLRFEGLKTATQEQKPAAPIILSKTSHTE